MTTPAPSSPRCAMRWPNTTSSIASCGAVTTSPMPSAGGSAPVSELRERVLYPKAGWLSLGLLVVMALAVSWAVQGAAWLDQLEFLPPVALWALVAGAVLGVLPVRVVGVLPMGAVVGAAIVLWTIGGEYYP